MRNALILLGLCLALGACGKKPAALVEPQFKWTTDQRAYEVDRCTKAIPNAKAVDTQWCQCWLDIAAKDYTYEYYGSHGSVVEAEMDGKGYFKLCEERYPRSN
jgi:hypothetical protein